MPDNLLGLAGREASFQRRNPQPPDRPITLILKGLCGLNSFLEADRYLHFAEWNVAYLNPAAYFDW